MSTTTTPAPDIWGHVRKEQLDKWDLDQTEKDLWHNCSLEDVNKKLQELDEDHKQSSKVRWLAGQLKGLMESLKAVGPAFDVLVQADPHGIASAAWGSVRLVLVLGQRFTNIYEDLMESMLRIVSPLVRLREYVSLFPQHQALRPAVAEAYRQYFICMKRIRDFLKTSRDAHSFVKKLRDKLIKTRDFLNFQEDLGKKISAMSEFCKEAEEEAKSAKAHSDAAFQSQQKVHNDEASSAWENMQKLQLEEKSQREIERREKEKQRQKKKADAVAAWLSPFNFAARQEDIFEASFPIGRWLLDSEYFKIWAAGAPWFLRCYGDAGAGKTTLSSIVINHLRQQTPEKPVLCIFLEQKPIAEYTLANLLGSLLKQLIQFKRPKALSVELQALYDAKTSGGRPKEHDIKRQLYEEISKCEQVYLVVDALDECPAPIRDRLRTELYALKTSKPQKVSLLITSRQIDGEMRQQIHYCDHCGEQNIQLYFNCKKCSDGKYDLCQKCHITKATSCQRLGHTLSQPYDWIEVDIRTPDDDLEQYIKWRMGQEVRDDTMQMRDDRNPYRSDKSRFARQLSKDAELLERIPKTILERAEGRFLWAKLYMDQLTRMPNLELIAETLDNSPKKLDDFYDDSVKRISANGEPDPDTGLRILALIACSHRALGLAELQHALATRVVDEEFHERRVIDKEDILEKTAGLITIDGDQSAAVRPMHATLLKYLGDHQDELFPDAELYMAQSCVVYLNFKSFSSPIAEGGSFEEKLTEYPFLAYASRYWGVHVRSARTDTEVNRHAIQLVTDRDRIAAYIQAAWQTSTHNDKSWDVRKSVDGLHVCAFYGLSSMISTLQQNERFNVDIKEQTYGQTPLMYACRRGNIEVVKQLIGLGADVNMVSDKNNTALFEAVWNNQVGVVEVLVSRTELHVNAKQSRRFDRTALMLGAELGHADIVNLLLTRRDIRTSLRDAAGFTALHLASRKGSSGVVAALLQIPEVVERIEFAETAVGCTALLSAAKENHAPVVRLLLEHGANSEQPELFDGQNAILRAAGNGCDEVLQAMIDFHVDLHCKDSLGRGALHVASANDQAETVRFLIQNGLDKNVSDDIGSTPLHDACRNGNQDVAEILLHLDADWNVEDMLGRTPLDVAHQYGQVGTISLLEKRRARTNRDFTNPQKFPVWSLVIRGKLDLVEEAIAVRRKELLDLEPVTQDSALHWSIHTNRNDMLQLLLGKADLKVVNINHKNRIGRTALHLAALKRNLQATQLLLDQDADVETSDRWGATPLHLANDNQAYDVGVALIGAGADVTPQRCDIQSLFFKAIEMGNLAAVKELLNSDADILERDSQGRTAWQVATESGNTEVLRFLKSTRSGFSSVRQGSSRSEGRSIASSRTSITLAGSQSSIGRLSTPTLHSGRAASNSLRPGAPAKCSPGTIDSKSTLTSQDSRTTDGGLINRPPEEVGLILNAIPHASPEKDQDLLQTSPSTHMNHALVTE